MKFEISDLEAYMEGLVGTLNEFESIWPEFQRHRISKDAAFVGWTVLCMIDFLNATLADNEGDDWKLD